MSQKVINNKFMLTSDVQIISTKYKTVYVDNDVIDKVNNLYVGKDGYIRFKGVLLHRFITQASKGVIVDHINNNKLDNRRVNLRITNYSVNNHNKPKQSNTSSKYVGVSYDKRKNKWTVQCGQHFVSYTNDEEDAAVLYNLAAKERWGNEANLNNVQNTKKLQLPIKNSKYQLNEMKYIYYNKNTRSYQIRINKKSYGYYKNAAEAQEVRDKVIVDTDVTPVLPPIQRNSDGIAVITAKYKQEVRDVLVDDDDYYNLKTVAWKLHTAGYAVNNKYGYMHRYIMKITKSDKVIDHINHNKLDNRKENLRVVDVFVNNQNKSKKKNAKHDYIGVHEQHNTTFSSTINFKSQKYNIGTFQSVIEAAYAYDQKALELYGSQAKINRIQYSNVVQVKQERESKIKTWLESNYKSECTLTELYNHYTDTQPWINKVLWFSITKQFILLT